LTVPPRVAAALLWLGFVLGVGVIVAMAWHPWAIGRRAGCPPGSATAWDGHCYPGNVP
jgi:hypothetical protein